MEEYKVGIQKHHDAHVSCLTPKGSLHDFKLSIVRKYLAGKHTLLDLGCGTGEFTIPLAKEFDKIVAVDFSPKMIAELKRRISSRKIANVDVYRGDFFDVRFKPRAFDSVISFSTLYYVRELDELMHLVSKQLKQDGIFIFDIGNKTSISAWYYQHKYKIYQNFVGIADLKAIVRKSGFDIIEEDCFELIPRFLILRGLLDIKIFNQTIDSLLSNLPLFKHFAFRYVLVCRKVV